MVHKPKHRVHSFRGLLGDGGVDEINLERQNVNLAFRIIKFELLQQLPGATDSKATVTINKESFTPSSTVDFSDPDVLAVGYFAGSATTGDFYTSITIFDNVLFSRNIFIGNEDQYSGRFCNYYIELEEVPVGAATLMQLKLGVARKLNLQQD